MFTTQFTRANACDSHGLADCVECAAATTRSFTNRGLATPNYIINISGATRPVLAEILAELSA